MIAVPLSAIPAAGDLRFAIYLREEGNGQFRFFRGRDYPLKTVDLDRLRDRGVKTLYLAPNEYRDYQDYIRHGLHDLLEDESTAVGQRVGILNEVVRDVLQETFRSGSVSKIVDETKELAGQAVGLICRPDFIPSELCSILYHDYGTFTHSANVAYYSILLAEGLGIRDNSELGDIAAGALLHDIGKLDVPESIITKQERLTDDEKEVIRRHPSDGFLKLQSRADLSFSQLMMTYQHHERVSGAGYPVGIGGSEIHEWARICSVADVFEALTSDRPYRKRLPNQTALEIMDSESERGLDREMLRCWKVIISEN